MPDDPLDSAIPVFVAALAGLPPAGRVEASDVLRRLDGLGVREASRRLALIVARGRLDRAVEALLGDPGAPRPGVPADANDDVLELAAELVRQARVAARRANFDGVPAMPARTPDLGDGLS